MLLTPFQPGRSSLKIHGTFFLFFLPALFVMLSGAAASHAQQSKTDSLRRQLETLNLKPETPARDTARVNTLNALSRQLWQTGGYDSALLHAQSAKQFAEKINFKRGTARAYNNIGNVYHSQGNYAEALKNHFAALKIAEEIGDKQRIASSYNNIGNVYNAQGNYPEALKNHFAALKIEEEIGDKQGIVSSYNNIGNVYHAQGNYPEALKNYFVTLKLAEEIGDKQGIATSYDNIGVIYKNQGNYPEALKNHFAALKLREEIGDKQGIAIALGNIGEVYMKQGKHKQAREYIDKSLLLSKELGDKEGYKGMYLDMALLDSAEGKFKSAYEHHKLYILYRDSLNNEEVRKKNLHAKMNYEFEKKESVAKVEQEKKDVLAAEEQIKQQMIRNAVIAVAALVIILLMVLYSRKQFRLKHQYQVNLNRQQQENTVAVFVAQEKERKRIAENLHDGVGTSMTVARMNFNALEEKIAARDAETRKKYRGALALLDKAIADARSVAHNLLPLSLEERGLAKALEDLADNINHSGAIRSEFHAFGVAEKLDKHLQLMLFYIGQELLTNCIRHSKASKVNMQLVQHPGSIVLIVEDNGAGFGISDVRQKNGMGISNMEARVRALNGDMHIDSGKNRGTVVTVEVPIQW